MSIIVDMKRKSPTIIERRNIVEFSSVSKFSELLTRVGVDGFLVNTNDIEYGGYETGSLEKPETYEDFRLAHIRVKLGEITNIQYTHYRLLPNKTWSIIASWESKLNETN